MLDPPANILIIRLSSIGDVLLSSPFVRQLRKHFSHARIDYLIKDQFKDLMRFNPHINNLYMLNVAKSGHMQSMKKQLKQNTYQIVFDLQNNLRSNYLKKGIEADSVWSIKKNKLQQLLLVLLKINCYREIQPIPKRYLHVAEKYNIADDNLGLEIFWQNEQDGEATRIAKEAGLPPAAQYVCLAPGAAHYTKRWPIEYFVTLSEKINQSGLKVVILGGEDDVKWGKILKNEEKIIDLTGRLSLLESAVILSRALGVVTNDSGLMHMATAVNSPVVALFGSTVREFGFFPFRGESTVLENNNLSCRPCTHIGRRSCPKKHFKCMMEISEDDVFTALTRLISRKS